LAKIRELEMSHKENAEKVVETKFKCYIISTTSSYNIGDKINDKYNNLEFMRKCLEDDETMKVFLDKKSWKKQDSYWNYNPNVREQLYNYQINFFGTIVGIYVNLYNNDVNANNYIVDNITICESMEKAQEQLVIKQREEIASYIKYTLEKS
jgi:hypothetical protein